MKLSARLLPENTEKDQGLVVKRLKESQQAGQGHILLGEVLRHADTEKHSHDGKIDLVASPTRWSPERPQACSTNRLRTTQVWLPMEVKDNLRVSLCKPQSGTREA